MFFGAVLGLHDSLSIEEDVDTKSQTEGNKV